MSSGLTHSQTDWSPVSPGELLEGRWRVERHLAEGGMGSVVLARELALDRLVAVKFVAPHLQHRAEFVERLEREAQLMAKLDHPNIVPVLAVGRHRGRPFIVIKYLEGISLADRLDSAATRLTRDEVLSIVGQLCDGLEYLHSKGLVHRDIKPSNVMISPTGHVTLCDLGLLKDSTQDGSTRTGALLGTPKYMSPEQILGDAAVDHRSDLYSLTVVLFLLLTGKVPFTADNETALAHKQAYDAPPSPRSIAPELPRAVDALIAKGLAKRPKNRFQSAAQLRAGIERAFQPQRSRAVVRWTVPALAATLVGVVAIRWTLRASESAGEAASRVGSREGETRTGQAAETGALAASTLETRALAAPTGSAAGTGALAAPTAGTGALAAPTGSAAETGALAARTAETGALTAPTAQPRALAATPEAGAPASSRGSGSEENAGAGSLGRAAAETAPPTRTRPPKYTKHRPGHGALRVVTTHQGQLVWANVSIDSRGQGATPLSIEIPAGRHRVHVERLGYRPIDREVTVAPSKAQTLTLELEP